MGPEVPGRHAARFVDRDVVTGRRLPRRDGEETVARLEGELKDEPGSVGRQQPTLPTRAPEPASPHRVEISHQLADDLAEQLLVGVRDGPPPLHSMLRRCATGRADAWAVDLFSNTIRDHISRTAPSPHGEANGTRERDRPLCRDGDPGLTVPEPKPKLESIRV
ncbi:hypothetical protein [Streptomyces sp. NPDC004266]|uniref:hypothetical protein n=1 Tax=Streptomyces sp. NPDC004266 TaxID=3364693 RepID=UPI003674DA38